MPRIREIYDLQTADAVGAAVRGADDKVWQALKLAIAEGCDECRVLTHNGAIAGYAWTADFIWWMQNKQREQPTALNIGEAFASDPVAADALLAGLRQWADEQDRAFADLHQPPVGSLGLAMRLQDTFRLTITFKDAQFMARSTGTFALLKALEPELSRRWRAVRTDWRGTLRLVCDGDAVDLVMSSDDVAVVSSAEASALTVELSPGNLARLALGSFAPDDLLARLGVTGEVAGNVDVLAVLFPERSPYLYPADRF